jgi:hypothetical protein
VGRIHPDAPNHGVREERIEHAGLVGAGRWIAAGATDARREVEFEPLLLSQWSLDLLHFLADGQESGLAHCGGWRRGRADYGHEGRRRLLRAITQWQTCCLHSTRAGSRHRDGNQGKARRHGGGRESAQRGALLDFYGIQHAEEASAQEDRAGRLPCWGRTRFDCVVPRFALDRLHPLQAARGGIPDDRGYLRSGRRIGRGKAAGGDRIGGERAALLARWPVDRVSAKFESTPLGDRWPHRLVAAGRRRRA